MKTTNPQLYQINTRVKLTGLSEQLQRPATLDDISDSELDDLATKGFDWIWLLSVWQKGPASQKVSQTNQVWRREFQQVLPDLQEGDIGGSGFAIADYTVDKQLGGPPALARLRQRLRKRGIKLLLDFVPNHTGLDHHWLKTNPQYYMSGTEMELSRAPQNYTRLAYSGGELILAHGRDPYFDGWPDTVQLNYANPSLQEAMINELLTIAAQCDGVRCDMAMLVLPDVFERTWGKRCPPFWSKAIQSVREKFPNFLFMAEVYWDLEWSLQQEGFDYTYDKRLYDRLREKQARSVREHLAASIDYQRKMARFLENHDEPRAASTFADDVQRAAAAITYLSPGLRFFHQGQFEGAQKHISPHLIRAPEEPVNHELKSFYDRLLTVLQQPVVREGQWQLLKCEPAWEGNETSECFICFGWNGEADERLLVAVNYASNQSQCYVKLFDETIAHGHWRLQDQMSSATYDRAGGDLVSRGLYLDMSPWQVHVFSWQSLEHDHVDKSTSQTPVASSSR